MDEFMVQFPGCGGVESRHARSDPGREPLAIIRSEPERPQGIVVVGVERLRLPHAAGVAPGPQFLAVGVRMPAEKPFDVMYLVRIFPQKAKAGDEFKIGPITHRYLGWEKNEDGYAMLLDSGDAERPWRAFSTPVFNNTDEIFHCWFVDVPVT